MFCPNCGNETLDDAAFCPNCGNSFGTDSQQQAAQHSDVQAQQSINQEINFQQNNQTFQHQIQNDGQQQYNPYMQNEQKKRTRKRIIIIISIAVALLLFAGGIAAFLLTQNQNSCEQADEQINQTLQADNFQALSKDEQCKKIQETLNNCVKAGSIENDVQFDTHNKVFSFTYSDGSLGGVDLGEYSSETNGSCMTEENLANARLFADNIAYADSSKKKMHIVYAFEEERKQTYLNIEEEWRKMGLDTSVDYDVSIDDLAHLKGYDSIMLSMHGNTYKKRPSLCLLEEVDDNNKSAYSDYIDRGLVVKMFRLFKPKVYWVLPEFFSYVYKNKELSKTCILSESCKFLGADDKSENVIDRSFPNNFEHAGASCTFGFRNTVSCKYSFLMNVGIVESMIENNTTIGKACDVCKNKFGLNDNEYEYEGKDCVATPHLFGNTNFSLGDPEKNKLSINSNVTKYLGKTYGEVKNMVNLGSYQWASGGQFFFDVVGEDFKLVFEKRNSTGGNSLYQIDNNDICGRISANVNVLVNNMKTSKSDSEFANGFGDLSVKYSRQGGVSTTGTAHMINNEYYRILLPELGYGMDISTGGDTLIKPTTNAWLYSKDSARYKAISNK